MFFLCFIFSRIIKLKRFKFVLVHLFQIIYLIVESLFLDVHFKSLVIDIYLLNFLHEIQNIRRYHFFVVHFLFFFHNDKHGFLFKLKCNLHSLFHLRHRCFFVIHFFLCVFYYFYLTLMFFFQ